MPPMPESSALLGARSLPSMKPAAVSSTTVKSRVTSTNTEPPSQPLRDRREEAPA